MFFYYIGPDLVKTGRMFKNIIWAMRSEKVPSSSAKSADLHHPAHAQSLF